MSQFEIACPKCNRRYRARRENVGSKARCSECNEVFVVQEPTSTESGTDEQLLVPCSCCGFQDFGNFCSNCGHVLSPVAELDFAGCKIPGKTIDEFARTTNSPAAEAWEDAGFEVREACKQFNNYIDELKRSRQFRRGKARLWPFDRSNVAQQIDDLPSDLPGGKGIAERLWTLIGYAEREMATEEIGTLADEVRACVQAEDIKKAEKTLNKVKSLIAELPPTGGKALEKELQAAVDDLKAKSIETSRLKEFNKLIDKADKLLFQNEPARARKAYQECRFWLSRNVVSSQNTLEAKVAAQLEKLQPPPSMSSRGSTESASPRSSGLPG